MNNNAPMYGLLKINDSETDLGHCKPGELLRRVMVAFTAHKGEANEITIRISKTPIVSLSMFSSPEDANLAEFESSIASAPPATEVELFPGVTVQAAYEAEQSLEGQAYKRICNPDKRVGVPTEIIQQTIDAYFARFPGIASLFPLWQD